MKSHEEIQSEINHLEKLKQEWSSVRLDKVQARYLLSKVKVFYDSLENRYKGYFNIQYPSISVLVHFEDAMKHLEWYSKSKLIKKDDVYFYKAGRNIIDGIEQIKDDFKGLLN